MSFSLGRVTKRAAIAGSAWLVVVFASVPAGALSPALAPTQYVHDVWQMRDGLPHDMVSALVQGQDGALWLGTQEGLLRYDGASFALYNRGSDPPLPSQMIQALLRAPDGALWVGTAQGVLEWRGRVTRTIGKHDGLPSEVVNALSLAPDGTLWVGTNRGLAAVSPRDLKVYDETSGLPSTMVYALATDRAGVLWVGTGDGLARFDRGQFLVFSTRDGLPHATVRALEVGRDGTVWIGTGRGLVCHRDGRIQAAPDGSALNGAMVTSLCLDSDGVLWIGTESSGLARLAHGSLEPVRVGDRLDVCSVKCMMESAEGDLWIGTLGDGLHRFRQGVFTCTSAAEGLADDSINAVLTARDGSVWVGGRSRGLSRLKDGAVEIIDSRHGLSTDYVSSLLEDRAGMLWIGTSHSVYQYRAGSAVVFRDAHGVSPDQTRCLYQDRRGDIWFGTRSDGLFRLRDGELRRYTSQDGLASDAVRGGIVEDPSGAIWVGTDGGASRIDAGGITNYSEREGLPASLVLALHVDARGRIWVGTIVGLARIQDGQVRAFHATDGLHDDLVMAILEDDAGHLWLTSNRGISRVAIADLDQYADGLLATIPCDVFGREAGLKTPECNGGTQPSAVRDGGGLLWFATNRGVAVVDPRTIRPAAAPRVRLDRAVIAGERVDLATPFAAPPGSGDLEFHYSVVKFGAAERIRFRYRLEGYDQTWQEAGTRRAAYYTNLPPGGYRFAVQASDERGSFTGAETSYAFKLRPHYHQTAAFRAAAVAALFAVIFCLFRWRVRSMRRRALLLAQMVRERTRELQAAKEEAEEATRARGQFLAHMSHEIRTPMTGVIGLTRLALETDQDEDRRQYLELVEGSARSLVDLINDILDFSKIDAGQLELVAEPFSLRRCVDEALLPVAFRAREKGYAVVADVAPGVPAVVLGDAGRLKQILINLLGNAVKFTDSGEVVLSVSLADAAPRGVTPGRNTSRAVALRFAVKDTGIGIPRAELDRVFDAFKQVGCADHRERGGTGLGLSISARLVALMGGELKVTSEVGKGSEFHFECRFPVVETASSELDVRTAFDRLGAAGGQVPAEEDCDGAPAVPPPGLRVLVAEDNAVNQLLLRRLLAKAGHAVVAVEDGEQALATIAAETFDVVLMDVQMPVRDGLEATAELRRREQATGKHLPIIALTAHAMAEDRERCLAAGMDAYVSKPIEPAQLFAAIAAVVRREPACTPQ